MLFMGDLIYADRPTWGGDNLEYYRKEYRRVYSSLSFRKVYEKLRKSSGRLLKRGSALVLTLDYIILSYIHGLG